jgi:hypothetical protein
MELTLRIAGTAVGVLGGFVTALWEVFLSPVSVVSPLMAVVGNVALVLFTKHVTGRTGLALLPGLVWFLTMFGGTIKTTEGDLPITGNDWAGLVALLAGAAAYGVTAYRFMLPARR